MDINVFLKLGVDLSMGVFDGKGVSVLPGSVISNRPMASTFKHADQRRELIQKYTEERNGKLILTESIFFPSPSAASNFCTGSSTNGLILWKTENGMTLSSYLRSLEDE